MEIGVFDHVDLGPAPVGRLYEDRLKLVERYDRAGFYCYHVAEHHATPLGMAPAPGIFLAAAAQRTRRIRLGPLVYILPLYDPLRLIEEVCMLDHLSAGRFQLGVGRGVSAFELAYFGVGHLDSQAIYEEALEVLRKGLASEVLDHRGLHYRYTGVPMALRPLQTPHPPLWRGVGGPEGAVRAAGCGVNVVSNAPCPAAAEITRRYREEWRARHPDAPLPKMGIARQVYVAATDAEAVRRARPAFDAWYASFAGLWRRFGAEPTRYPGDFDLARRADAVVAGSPDTVRAEIERQMAESGCNYFVCRFAYGDLDFDESARSLDLFAGEVMPRLAGG